ncbi:putative apyrase 6 isoform X2 [Wolffia australiana]
MRRVNAKPPAVLGHLHSIAIRAKTQMEKPIFPSPSLSIFTQIASSGKRSHLSGGFWLAILTAAALSLFLIACFLPVRSDLRFEIIIDGGSTGTRIHVFAYAVGQGGMPVLDLGATSTLKENPGLSAYAGNPDLAGESLAGLLDFGKTKVPRSQWGQTKVRVMATAGLRLLDIRVQERILESCRKALRVSGFLFRSEWASVISGTDEGIYAWVAANYALGTLGADPGETTGIIELGGASAQVTFVSNEQLPPEFVHVLRFGKVTYNLYSHSFLHFGQNAAHETFHKILSSRERNSDKTSSTVRRLADPCAPKGFSKGLESVSSQVIATGNFSECRSAVQDLLQKREEDCAYKECRLGSAFVPALHGRFLATENFFFTSKFFRLGRKAILLDFIAAGERFCGQDWMRLKRKYYSMDEDDLPRYCFSSAYIVALLHDGLGVSLDDKRIMYTNKVGNVPLDWALGSFLLLAATTERGRDPGLSSQ